MDLLAEPARVKSAGAARGSRPAATRRLDPPPRRPPAAIEASRGCDACGTAAGRRRSPPVAAGRRRASPRRGGPSRDRPEPLDTAAEIGMTRTPGPAVKFDPPPTIATIGPPLPDHPGCGLGLGRARPRGLPGLGLDSGAIVVQSVRACTMQRPQCQRFAESSPVDRLAIGRARCAASADYDGC